MEGLNTQPNNEKTIRLEQPLHRIFFIYGFCIIIFALILISLILRNENLHLLFFVLFSLFIIPLSIFLIKLLQFKIVEINSESIQIRYIFWPKKIKFFFKNCQGYFLFHHTRGGLSNREWIGIAIKEKDQGIFIFSAIGRSYSGSKPRDLLDKITRMKEEYAQGYMIRKIFIFLQDHGINPIRKEVSVTPNAYIELLAKKIFKNPNYELIPYWEGTQNLLKIK